MPLHDETLRPHQRPRLLAAALAAGPMALCALALVNPGAPSDRDGALGMNAMRVELASESDQSPSAGRSGASCPLPLGRQVQAVNAFTEMLPVLRHPRCMNCHGGYDPMSQAHDGYREARASGLNPLTGILTVEQRLLFHADCGNCHDNISGEGIRPTRDSAVVVSGWMIAPQPMQWVGQDDEALCRLLKSHEPNGSLFIDHVMSDHGEVEFIEAAFRGDRALGVDGLDTYGLVAEPPPGSASDLLGQAQRWVNIMGAENDWVGEPSCGCVMPGLRLEVRHTWEVAVPGGVPSRQQSNAQFEVTLQAAGDDRPGFYEGDIAVDRTVDMTLPRFCTGRASVSERWHFNALVDGESGTIRVWHTQLPNEPVGYIECRQGGGTARMGVDPGVAMGLLGSGETVIPADETSERMEASMEGMRESLTITVIAEPPGD